jgi:hypothetical protein
MKRITVPKEGLDWIDGFQRTPTMQYLVKFGLRETAMIIRYQNVTTTHYDFNEIIVILDI